MARLSSSVAFPFPLPLRKASTSEESETASLSESSLGGMVVCSKPHRVIVVVDDAAFLGRYGGAFVKMRTAARKREL